MQFIHTEEVKIIMNKDEALEAAIDIVKAYGNGGYSDLTPDVILEKVYDKIIKLSSKD